uniref:Uncharacterized protein n=1 Tax=Lates calcarifer TaxID=8187 RepID=A0A4W6CK71_LATCA
VNSNPVTFSASYSHNRLEADLPGEVALEILLEFLQLSCHLWNKKTKHSCTTKRAAPTETQASPSVNARPLVHTLVLERWLGSSLDCSFPAPSVGSWVWKTVTLPLCSPLGSPSGCQ